MRERGERDRNEERRVPRGNIHKEEEDEREEGCLSGWLAGIMMAAVFGSFSSRKKTHSNIYYGKGWSGEGAILD